MKYTRLLIADDHTFVRKGILMFLDTEPSVKVVGEAIDGQEAVRKAIESKPDVILMDLVMPHGGGIEAITELKQRLPGIKVIVLTSFGDEELLKAAMKAGANGYLLKDADGEALLQAIETVQQGGVPLHPSITKYLVKNMTEPVHTTEQPSLTEREKEVLQLVGKGLTNRAVAEALSITQGTVKVHISKILAKLNADSRTEAAMWAVQAGLVSLNEYTS